MLPQMCANKLDECVIAMLTGSWHRSLLSVNYVIFNRIAQVYLKFGVILFSRLFCNKAL